MFSCCDSSTSEAAVTKRNSNLGPGTDDSDVLDLYEDAAILIVLLRLLHSPPNPPVLQSEDIALDSDTRGRKTYDLATVIPLPLIPVILSLVDKYALPESTLHCLAVHLEAHAPHEPLRVYGLATLYALDTVASRASQYIAPMASYPPSEVKEIPVEAYHQIVQLQAVRVKALQKLLLGEDLFPHGACISFHISDTMISSMFLRIRRMSFPSGHNPRIVGNDSLSIGMEDRNP